MYEASIILWWHILPLLWLSAGRDDETQQGQQVDKGQLAGSRGSIFPRHGRRLVTYFIQPIEIYSSDR